MEPKHGGEGLYLNIFECSKYIDIRRNLLTCVNRFGIKIYLALLTRGNKNLTYEDNCLIFKGVY